MGEGVKVYLSRTPNLLRTHDPDKAQALTEEHNLVFSWSSRFKIDKSVVQWSYAWIIPRLMVSSSSILRLLLAKNSKFKLWGYSGSVLIGHVTKGKLTIKFCFPLFFANNNLSWIIIIKSLGRFIRTIFYSRVFSPIEWTFSIY